MTVITWQKTLTPAALAATIETQEQTFTTGVSDIPGYQEMPNAQFGTAPGTYGLYLTAADMILVTPPNAGANNDKLSTAIYAYVSTAGNLGTAVITIGFANLTAAANTPASGTYTFALIRN